MVGEALVPYYRQILPILNIFKNMNCKYGLSMINIDKKDNKGDRKQFHRIRCWKRPVARWPNAPNFCLGPPEISKILALVAQIYSSGSKN